MLHSETKLAPPLASPKRQEGEFVVFDEVAFFKEHINREGVRIDRAALERICQRCNERIRDTGDFPPVVLRHTTDEGDRDPEVVGFAGSFRLGSVGNLRPKAAIFGTMWIFAEDAARVKKYPRLSVEYWASEDDPTNGYFDPVSLLGAETPELDLGIRYSRGRKGKRPLRYARVERFAAKRVAMKESASVPTVAVNGLEVEEESTARREDETGLARDETPRIPPLQEVDEIGDETVSAAQAATERPADVLEDDEQGDAEDAIDLDEASDEPSDEPENNLGPADIQAIVEALKPVIQTAVREALEVQLELAAGDEDEAEDEDVDEDVFDDDVGEGDSMEREEADEAESRYKNSEPDEEPEYADRTARHLALFDPDSKGDDSLDVDAATGDMEEPFDFMDEPLTEEGDVRAEDQARRHTLHGAGRRFSGGDSSRQQEIENMRAEKRRAVRFQKLAELQSQGCALDVEDEVAENQDLDDAAFEKHCRRIATKYQRVPLGYVRQPRAESSADSHAVAKRARYVKQASENVLKAREQGLHIDFKDELERLTSEGSAMM